MQEDVMNEDVHLSSIIYVIYFYVVQEKVESNLNVHHRNRLIKYDMP